MHEEERQWLDADTDRLFRPTLKFAGNVQPFCLSDPLDTMPYVASAFSSAAGELLRRRLSNCPDPDAWPITFLYRHACELHLKAIILSGDLILMHDKKQSSGLTKVKDKHLCFKSNKHQLDPLIAGATHIIASLQLRWPPKPGMSDWPSARDRIAEFQEVDSTSFTFRYPIDTSGKRVKPAYMIFDIVHFARTIEAVLGGLETMALECERRREVL